MMTLIQRERIRPICWGVVMILWVGMILLNWVIFTRGDTSAYGRYDFFAYATGAQALIDGVSPYRPQFDVRHLYLYPPLLAQVLAPFIATIGEPLSANLWYILNIACLIGMVRIMCQYTAPQHHIWLWLLPVVFIPITHTLYIGQITIILTYLFMLTWRDWHRQKLIRAGMWLGLACWIKVFPAFMVLFFVLRRDWRVIRGVMIAGIGLGILQIVVSGVDMMLESFHVLLVLFTRGQNDGMFQNSSIAGFTSKLFVEHPRLIPVIIDNTLFQISRYGLVLFTLTTTYVLSTWQVHMDDARQFDLGYSATMMMALLVGYTLWITGMPSYLLAFWVAFRYSNTWRSSAILLVAVMALVLYFPLITNLGELRLPWWSTYSIGFYATYTLWGVLVYRLARR